jgi:nitrogen fixation/metabolism regulation signal transduction histidine kinase
VDCAVCWLLPHRGDDGAGPWPHVRLVQFFRSTLLPAAIVLLFALALVAVSARIWLPGDMAAPAPLG